MLAIGDPLTGSRGVFTGRDDGRVTDQRDQIALPLHLQAEHTKAILGVVEGDPLDEPGESVEFGPWLLGK
jgi:hypothetical protein